MKKQRLAIFHDRIGQTQMRLAHVTSWYPLPATIGFVLCLLFAGEVLPGLNPQRGFKGQLVTLAAEHSHPSTVWFGVLLEKEELYIISSRRKVLRLPRQITDPKDLEGLVELLKNETNERIKLAALSRKISSNEITVTLAVDEKLRYSHIRPILQALALAKITNYAFETQRPGPSESSLEKG